MMSTSKCLEILLFFSQTFLFFEGETMCSCAIYSLFSIAGYPTTLSGDQYDRSARPHSISRLGLHFAKMNVDGSGVGFRCRNRDRGGPRGPRYRPQALVLHHRQVVQQVTDSSLLGPFSGHARLQSRRSSPGAQ